MYKQKEVEIGLQLCYRTWKYMYLHTYNRNLGIFHMTIEDEDLFYHCVVWKNSTDFPLHYVLSHLLIIRVILKRLLILLIKNIIMTKQIYKDTYICVTGTCSQKNFSMIKIYSTKKIRCACETQIPQIMANSKDGQDQKYKHIESSRKILLIKKCHI